MSRCDNQTGGPPRPYAVSDDELERALRETFARHVAVPRPLAADPAGTALRRATWAARRRTLTGLALAGVATVLVSTGMAQLGDRPGPAGPPTVVLGDPHGTAPSPLATPRSATPRNGPVRAEIDLVIGNVLDTSGGEQRELTGVDAVERAQRVADYGGWLVTSAATTAGRTLWWVPPNGSAPQVLLAGAEAVALSPDGRQVAWRDGPEIVGAGLVGGQLVAVTRTPAPAGAVPVGFTGDAVLVQRPDGGTVLWRRSAGPLPTAAARTVRTVFGTLPDGRVVGQVDAEKPRRTCLALLDPARGLAPVRTDCDPALAADGRGGISTDGRWLLANGAAKRDALLIDLTRLGAGNPARPAGPAVAGAVSWTKSGTALYVDGKGGLVRARVDRVVAGERASAAAVTGVTPGERPVVVTDALP
jgi:hypothetical protein